VIRIARTASRTIWYTAFQYGICDPAGRMSALVPSLIHLELL